MSGIMNQLAWTLLPEWPWIAAISSQVCRACCGDICQYLSPFSGGADSCKWTRDMHTHLSGSLCVSVSHFHNRHGRFISSQQVHFSWMVYLHIHISVVTA